MEVPTLDPVRDYAHRVAMYDMDRTITRSGTYSGFLMHVARRRQQWRLLLLPLVVGRSFNRAEIAPLAESYADQVIARGVHAAALDQIAADRAAGYRVLLATASFHLYVDAIARRLGIDDVLATRLDAPDGADHIHARLAGDNCYGAAKFARIGEWLADNAITREDAHIRAYSDHVSDHPMLGFADEAVATTPSRALKKLAPQRGWAVVDWRQKT